MSKVRDLTNQKFGMLKVIKRSESNTKEAKWLCECECGNLTVVLSSNLTRGKTKSCGCNRYNFSRTPNYNNYSKNEYEFTSDTCIGYTGKGEIFLVDIDKYDLIKDYRWCINSDGYVFSSGLKNRKGIFMHRLIMNCPNDKLVDHVRGYESKHDNRILNLRICNHSENSRNSKVKKNSRTGVKGVSIYKEKYKATITHDDKIINLGLFDTIKEASDVYDEAAKKYFGEFAWLNNYQQTI